MSTENKNWRWTYQPNGVSTAFAFDNLVLAASDLIVLGWQENGLPLSLPAHTVTGVGNKNGGNVVFNSPPPAVTGSIIEVTRVTTKLQGRVFKDFVQETASVREQMADRAMLGLQEAEGQAGRALTTSPLDGDNPLVLPPRQQLANRYLFMRSDGQLVGVEGGLPVDGKAYGVAALPDLKALPHRPATVQVGYMSGMGDGWGGPFVWRPGATTPADDNFSVQPIGGDPGRFERVHDGGIDVHWCKAKADGFTDDSTPFAAALAAGYYAQGRPGKTYLVKDLTVGLVQTFNGRGCLLKAASGATRIFALSSYNPRLEKVYIADNAAASGAAIEINALRFGRVRHVVIVGASAGAILLRDAGTAGVSVPNLFDIHAEQITGIGIEIQHSVSEIKAANLHMMAHQDFVGGLGKPRAGSIGWRQNTPVTNGHAVGGHQIVNANMIGLQTGWHITDGQLSKYSNCIADGCTSYGLKIDGASQDLDFDNFFCATSLGIHVSGTANRISFNGLRTIFNGVVPPWGRPDFYDSAGPYYDVTVAGTAKVVINGDAWRGEKRVSVAPGASLDVTGGVWFRGRTVADIAAGSTVFLAEGGHFASETDAGWRADFDFHLFQINASTTVAPGGAESFTYTVCVNGADTAMTTTISGAGDTASAYGPVFVMKGQFVSLKRVSTAGATINGRDQVNVQALGV